MKTKLFSATCENGVVKVSGITVNATILTAGTESSSGMFILEGSVGYYVASNTSDLVSLISSVYSLLNSVKTILTGLDGVTVTPGTQAGAIAALATPLSELSAQKDNLK